MKNFIIAIAAIAVFTGGPLSALCQERTSDSQVLSLSRAISLALENNRSAKNAKLEVEKSADKVAQLRTRRLPAFTVSGLVAQPLSTFDTKFEKGVFGTYPGIGPVPAETTSITSSTKPTALLIAQVSQP